MKANELMIGNYVKFLGKVRKIKSIVRKDTGVEISFEGKNPVVVSLDEIKPIPLTPEILEKNGFKKDKDGYYVWKEKIYGYVGQSVSVTTPSRIIISESGFGSMINAHDGSGFDGDLSFVHQLQLALCLCGIEKEITI